MQHRNCRIAVEEVVKASNAFLGRMYNKLEKSDDNAMMSHFSLMIITYILFEGAGGLTREQVRGNFKRRHRSERE